MTHACMRVEGGQDQPGQELVVWAHDLGQGQIRAASLYAYRYMPCGATCMPVIMSQFTAHPRSFAHLAAAGMVTRHECGTGYDRLPACPVVGVQVCSGRTALPGALMQTVPCMLTQDSLQGHIAQRRASTHVRRTSALESLVNGNTQPKWQLTYQHDAYATRAETVDATRKSELDKVHLTKVATGGSLAAASPAVARARRLSSVVV